MELSKQNTNILTAYARGYRVRNGIVYSPYRKEPLKLDTNKDGYRRFGINIESGDHVSIFVHQLVAYQKYGYKSFEKGIEVRHKNGDSTDNSDENILIGTSSENSMDKPPEIRMSLSINAAEKLRKFTDIEMNEIKEYYDETKSYKKTMTQFNITSKGTLFHILHNKYKTKK